VAKLQGQVVKNTKSAGLFWLFGPLHSKPGFASPNYQNVSFSYTDRKMYILFILNLIICQGLSVYHKMQICAFVECSR